MAYVRYAIRLRVILHRGLALQDSAIRVIVTRHGDVAYNLIIHAYVYADYTSGAMRYVMYVNVDRLSTDLTAL